MVDRHDPIERTRTSSQTRFARLVARPEPDIDLAVGALVIAAHGRSGVDEPAALAQLDRVLARGVGLPISLAIIELEVAWRIGLPLVGVGLPGHFIVGGPDGMLFDPADGGRSLTPDDCQALIHRSVGD